MPLAEPTAHLEGDSATHTVADWLLNSSRCSRFLFVYFFTEDRRRADNINIVTVGSRHLLTDIVTKQLPEDPFVFLLALLRLRGDGDKPHALSSTSGLLRFLHASVVLPWSLWLIVLWIDHVWHSVPQSANVRSQSGLFVCQCVWESTQLQPRRWVEQHAFFFFRGTERSFQSRWIDDCSHTEFHVKPSVHRLSSEGLLSLPPLVRLSRLLCLLTSVTFNEAFLTPTRLQAFVCAALSDSILLGMEMPIAHLQSASQSHSRAWQLNITLVTQQSSSIVSCPRAILASFFIRRNISRGLIRSSLTVLRLRLQKCNCLWSATDTASLSNDHWWFEMMKHNLTI